MLHKMVKRDGLVWLQCAVYSQRSFSTGLYIYESADKNVSYTTKTRSNSKVQPSSLTSPRLALESLVPLHVAADTYVISEWNLPGNNNVLGFLLMP